MTEPPLLPLPPFGDDTDEALNALLDGELGAFADDHGLHEDEVREQLDEWPGTDARLAELEQVRAAMQSPVPSLDDVTRRRLVRTAANARPGQAAEPSRRSRSWIAVVSVAAAGLLVLIGIGAAISSMGSGEKSDSSGSAATSADAPLRGEVGGLGDVTDPAALRALLDRREAASANQSQERAADSAAGSAKPGVADLQPPTANAVTVDDCVQTLTPGGTVAFSGTGTYRGAPATIIGITEGARTIVFVVSSTDCTDVLASISR